MAAERIRFVIDLDGFTCARRFVPKELGIYDVDADRVVTYHFRTNHLIPKNTTAKEFADLTWTTRYVHGLDIRDDRPGDCPAEGGWLLEIVGDLASVAEEEGRLVAFKGGQFEKKALEAAGYRNYINLESLGVPKIEVILQEAPELRTIVSAYSCRRHHMLRGAKRHVFPHCSGFEVKLFYAYYKRGK